MSPNLVSTADARSPKRPFVVGGSLLLAAVGVWEILSPSVIGYTDWRFGRWNDVVCGALVVVLALATALFGRPAQGLWRIVLRAAPAIAIVGIGVYLTTVDFALYYARIGRVDTFFNHLVAATLIILGLLVAATVLGLEQRPLTATGEEALRDAHLARVT